MVIKIRRSWNTTFDRWRKDGARQMCSRDAIASHHWETRSKFTVHRTHGTILDPTSTSSTNQARKERRPGRYVADFPRFVAAAFVSFLEHYLDKMKSVVKRGSERVGSWEETRPRKEAAASGVERSDRETRTKRRQAREREEETREQKGGIILRSKPVSMV